MNALWGPEVEPTPRWVRVKFGGEVVADSKRCLLVRHYAPGSLPTYYFPKEDVKVSFLHATNVDSRQRWFDITTSNKVASACAWEVTNENSELNGYVTFVWNDMDAWYEEAEEIFVHARDPYKRVDVLNSSRHVRVELDGQVLAETKSPQLLFETGLPVRYYIPRTDVSLHRLVPTELTTRCPYKGIAEYWSVQVNDNVHENLAWSYPEPLAECAKVKQNLCFFNEKVDIYVDGERQARPVSPWS